MNKAPWSDEVVEALKWYQTCDLAHPYTCMCDGSPALSVTTDGFVCEQCGRKQDWCMADIVEFVTLLKKNYENL